MRKEEKQRIKATGDELSPIENKIKIHA